MRRWLLKFMLKLSWSVGGAPDHIDGLPRLTATDIDALVPLLEPGDLVLIGNEGSLSHIAVHVGGGEIVHAMATEQTMRGMAGSLWDALKRPLRWLWGIVDHAGVLQETLAQFVERFERDTYVVLRPSASPDGRARGLAHVRSLVGKGYDYTFTPGDGDYYCTEVALDYVEVATGTAPAVTTTAVRVPGLLNAEVIEPMALLDIVAPVLANEAARSRFADRLGDARVLPTASEEPPAGPQHSTTPRATN
ncbi:MAG: hypothetical protein ACI8PZ_004349 [Myxococcota bacterium]|jgi:hypothetical protein